MWILFKQIENRNEKESIFTILDNKYKPIISNYQKKEKRIPRFQ